MTYSITRKIEFDAGHRVPRHASKCKSPHGHRYVAEITCAAAELTIEGFVVDFGVVKQVVGGWVDMNWDHTMLYQHGDPVMEAMRAQVADAGLRPWYGMTDPPTAEHMAHHLFDVATELLRDHRVEVRSVRIWETPNCYAEWPIQ